MDNNTNEMLIPFACLEVIEARHTRSVKRLCISFVIAICILAICNTCMFAFLCNKINANIDERQAETTTCVVEQDE